MITPISMVTQAVEAFRPQASASVASGPDFSTMIGQAAQSAVQTMHDAERVTASGIAGKTDTQAVVQALTNAELTMQTAVAVRDKILGAYNDVMHMAV